MLTTTDKSIVSVIIAVYNGEAYLAEAIDSALNQTYETTQVVVVDDGSTDSTPQVIAKYGNRVLAMRQANRGVSVARNEGAHIATGSLLSFLDADDRLHPDKVARQVAAMAADTSIDLCDCHSTYFWSPELTDAQRRKDPRFAQDFWQKVLPGHISTWLLRRGLWDRVGGFEPGRAYAEDVDWFSRARDAGMVQHTLTVALTQRRLHLSNVTVSSTPRQGDDLLTALKAHMDRRRAKGGCVT